MKPRKKRVVILKVVYDLTSGDFVLTRRDKAGELIEESTFSSFDHAKGRLKNIWGMKYK